MAKFVRQAPRLPESIEKELRNKGIVLRRGRAGNIHFACSYRERFSQFVVTRRGKQWLQELGFEEGNLIDRHLVQELHDFGFIEVHEPLTPVNRRARPAATVRNSRLVEIPEWLSSVRKRYQGRQTTS